MQSLEATTEHKNLSELLEEIRDVDLKIGELSGRLDDLKAHRASLEKYAVASMESSGLDGVRAAGRSWRVEDSLHLSVPKDRRDAVLEAARAVGIEDAITTVATTTLKSWLVEKAKEAGREAGQPFTTGTPFAGLVGEFVERKLRHLTVG
jgi:hypothetical protein